MNGTERTTVARYLRDEAAFVERRIARFRVLALLVVGLPLTAFGLATGQVAILQPAPALIVWLVTAVALDRALASGHYASWIGVVATVVDPVLLTAMVLLIDAARGDPAFGPTASHTYLYFPIIALAALRQSRSVSLTAGAIGAGCYLVLVMVTAVLTPDRIVLAELGSTERVGGIRIAMIVAAMLLTGVVGAMLSARSRHLVATALNTRTFLFSDLRDFTSFVEMQGDAAAAEVIREYRALVRREIARTGGGEVKTEGDSFYIVFESARQALACGVGIQRSAAQLSTEDRPIRIGMGIHAGEPVPHDGQFVGSAVNIAARLAQNAAAGELLVSDVVRGLLRTSDVPPMTERAVALKGITDPPRAYLVDWRS